MASYTSGPGFIDGVFATPGNTETQRLQQKEQKLGYSVGYLSGRATVNITSVAIKVVAFAGYAVYKGVTILGPKIGEGIDNLGEIIKDKAIESSASNTQTPYSAIAFAFNTETHKAVGIPKYTTNITRNSYQCETNNACAIVNNEFLNSNNKMSLSTFAQHAQNGVEYVIHTSDSAVTAEQVCGSRRLCQQTFQTKYAYP